MKPPNENSISRWIDDLKIGDDGAAAKLWDRYFSRLIGLARKRLAGFPARMEDEEDIVISVFESLCDGAAAGRFTELSDRDDLWRLLVVITCHKSTNVKRRAGRKKRGRGQVRGESVFATADVDRPNAGLDGFAIDEPSPELLVELEDSFQSLMNELGSGDVREVAHLKMQGYTSEEIAQQLAISLSSVERKLRLIRQKWSRVLET